MIEEEKPKTKKLYIIPVKRDIASREFCNKVRERLKLTHRQLSNTHIKKICTLNNTLMKEWIVENADGFHIKNNGVLIVSKFLPKYLRGDKDLTIEAIRNNDQHDEKRKAKLIARYEKSITDYKKWGKEGEYNLNTHSFFYMYRAVWLNQQNCDFDKADLYKFVPAQDLKHKVNHAVVRDKKEYYEWLFSDFRASKKGKKEERANEKQRQKGKARKLREFLEKQDGNNIS